MTMRCVQCGWEALHKTGDIKKAHRIAKIESGSGYLFGGNSLCETHMAQQYMAMAQKMQKQFEEEQKKAEAAKAAETQTTPAPVAESTTEVTAEKVA